MPTSKPDAGADERRLASALDGQVRALLQVVRHSAVEEVRLERLGVRIALRRALLPAAGPAQGLAGSPPAAAAEAPPEPARTEVRAHMVGTFHRSRGPNEPPLAQDGAPVEAGQAIAVVETLGMSSEVEAPGAGRLSEFMVEDGQPVEFGQVLAVLEPE